MQRKQNNGGSCRKQISSSVQAFYISIFNMRSRLNQQKASVSILNADIISIFAKKGRRGALLN